MKGNKTYKRLVIFSIAIVMCLSSISILSATPFEGTPSPSLDPVFGTLIDFDDQPTGTPVGEFDYVAEGVASIVELEGLGTFARYAGSQSEPNYIGTGFDGERGNDYDDDGWDGTILIELTYPTNKIGIGVANNIGGPETVTIYDSEMNVLETQTAPDGGNVYCGFERSTVDILYLEIYGDFFAIDDLQFNYIPAPEVSKVILDGSEPIPEFVPIFTNVWWDLEITVENPYDDQGDALEDVWVYDGIGAKLDLVIQNDGTDDYIFTVDGSPIYLVNDDDQYYGDESGPVTWRQANGKPAPAKHPCATNVWWEIGDLDDEDSTTLEFRVETIEFKVNGNKNKDEKTKQAFTSTCHHEINDGPIATYEFDGEKYYVWGDPVIVSVYDPIPGENSDGDAFDDITEVEEYGSDPCQYNTFIYWDNYHDDNNIYDDYDDYVAALLEEDYIIDVYDAQEIDYDTLSPFDILVMLDVDTSLTEDEITAIQDWLDDGDHGLFIIGDNGDAWNEGTINDLLQADYNIECLNANNYPGQELVITEFATHDIFDGITEFEIGPAPGEITAGTPSAEIAWIDAGQTEAIMAAYEGASKIVVIVDFNMFENDLIEDYDNMQLGMNIFDWLAS